MDGKPQTSHPGSATAKEYCVYMFLLLKRTAYYSESSQSDNGSDQYLNMETEEGEEGDDWSKEFNIKISYPVTIHKHDKDINPSRKATITDLGQCFYAPELSGRIMVRRGHLSVCLGVCLSVGLSAKLVNKIQTEPFQLGPSNLVHIQKDGTY